jgi:hypothetical protein
MIDDFKLAHPPHRPETTRWSRLFFKPRTRPNKSLLLRCSLAFPIPIVFVPRISLLAAPSLHSVDRRVSPTFSLLRCAALSAGLVLPQSPSNSSPHCTPQPCDTTKRDRYSAHGTPYTNTHTHTHKTGQHAVGSMGAKARTTVGSKSMASRRTKEGWGAKHAALRRRAMVVSISINGAEPFITRLRMDPGSSKKRRLSLACKIKPMLPRRI